MNARLGAPADECVFARDGVPSDAGPWAREGMELVTYCPEGGAPDACVPAWTSIGLSCWASDSMFEPPKYRCGFTDAGCAKVP